MIDAMTPFSNEVDRLIDQANRARRLARSVADSTTEQGLIAYAVQCERQLSELIANKTFSV